MESWKISNFKRNTLCARHIVFIRFLFCRRKTSSPFKNQASTVASRSLKLVISNDYEGYQNHSQPLELPFSMNYIWIIIYISLYLYVYIYSIQYKYVKIFNNIDTQLLPTCQPFLWKLSNWILQIHQASLSNNGHLGLVPPIATIIWSEVAAQLTQNYLHDVPMGKKSLYVCFFASHS